MTMKSGYKSLPDYRLEIKNLERSKKLAEIWYA